MERGFPEKDGVSGKDRPTEDGFPKGKGPGRLIFMTGGVVSSIGKGLAAASLAALLRARGFTVALRKLDPYLNVDPGTMSPYQHGEVFVTDDGAETDLDLGHYERFTGRAARSRDSLSAGRVYADLLASERRGDLLGATVQVVPHVTNAIRAAMLAGIRPAPKGFEDEDGGGEDSPDFTLVEIGGTIGDIEGQPFLEAARQTAQLLGPDRAAFIHLTLVPWIAAAGELKTKPTQHSVREMRAAGIQPDILLLRADREIPKEDRAKIAMFCNVPESRVIQAQDVPAQVGDFQNPPERC